MQKKFWLLLFSALLTLSCSEDAEVIPLGLDYFPINAGEYREYDVTETTYVDKIETIENYQLREQFYDSIVNGEEITYLMRIERRETDLDIWVSVDNVSVRQLNTNLEYQEQNVKYVKMSYPVISGRKWDGNAQNQSAEQVYHYEELSTGDFTFDDSDHVKVIISDLPANIVEQDSRFETYAQGIGLVERNFIEIDFCQSNCDSQVNLPEDGRILIQRLITFGND